MENLATGLFRDGRLVGAHGAARDMSERERLERHLRRRAAELATSSERAHLARELHDSVTQALFAMTLVSRSIELRPGSIERDGHAGAKLAQVRVERTPRVARLIVRDDGRGFDPAGIPEGHLGVAGMRARAERVGGTFALDSAPGTGTTVTVELPLP